MKKRNAIKRIILGGILISSLMGSLCSANAQTILENKATGNVNGVPLLTSKATVHLRLLSGNAVSLAVAEMTPNSIPTSRTGVLLTYFILPTINPGDSGMDQVTIVAPSEYTHLAVTSVTLGQTAQTLQCSSPSAGQYCSTFAEQVITIQFGARITTTLTPIKITLTVDTPTTLQEAPWTSTVDDTATPAPPQTTLAGDANGDPADENSASVFVSNAADPILSTVIAEPAIVLADGIASSTITTTLMDVNKQYLQKKRVVNSSDRNQLATSSSKMAPMILPDIIVQPATPTEANGSTISFVRSTQPGIAIIASTDVTDGVTLTKTAPIFFTQGMVLKLAKSAHKKTGTIGDLINYKVEIRNTTTKDVTQVHIEDQLPPPFKYISGSVLLNNQPIPDPSGNTTRVFDIGTISAMNDQNGNGQADPGESGYATLQYQLVIGTAAKPGLYRNTAIAKDVCDTCIISNSSEAVVDVTLDPLFDMGTIIGKVFWDNNGDGIQNDGESGTPQVVVVLDDGTYAITDTHGLYHFPGVRPGERLIKIDAQTLPSGASVTTKERQIVSVSQGGLVKASFGITGKHTFTLSMGSPQEEYLDTSAVDEPNTVGATHASPLRDTPTVPESRDVDEIPNNDVGTKKQKLFFMAFADGEFGHLSTSGNLNMAGTNEHKDYYEKGRIAYYFKGMVSGKYLITSAFDTGKHRTHQMFKNLDEDETDRFLTYIDPDKFYPVYGDESIVVHDAQSQGKFYLAVESDLLQALIGNYAIHTDDTELAAFNRTLYGGQVRYKSLSKTAYGDPNTHILLFGAQVRQAHVENILRATGGSLYYLSEREIIEGSERVQIEIRDQDTGLILRQIPKTRDIDYTLKYEEGRILFNIPISSVANNTLLIHQPGLQGHPIFIVVDFEHEVSDFEKTAQGARIRQQIGHYLAIGGTIINEDLYTLSGGDLTVRWGQGTKIVSEIANSQGKGMSSLTSDNGGLTYTSRSSSAQGKGDAYKIAGRFDFADFNPLFKTGTLKKDRVVVEAYYKSFEPNFFANGTLLDQGTLKYGGWIQYRLTPQETLSVRSDWQESEDVHTMSRTQRIRLSEINLTRTNGPLTYRAGLQERIMEQSSNFTKQDTFAGQLGWTVNKRLSTTLDHQRTVRGPHDWQTTAGATYQLTSSLSTLAQGMYGHNQNGVLVGVSANVDPRLRIYTHQKWTQTEGQPDLWGNVIGGERKITDQSRIYTEYERDQGSLDQNRRLWGLDQVWPVTKPLRIHFHFEQSTARNDTTSIAHNAFGISSNYEDTFGLRLSDRIEVRTEEGQQLQWLTTHTGKLKAKDNLTLFLKFHYSKTEKKVNSMGARFREGSIGAAYRPRAFDHLNGLAKYTHLSDQREDATPLHTSANIGSTEWLYDVTPRIQWMEKIAVKVSENRHAPHAPTKSQTRLWINRVHYRIAPLWDAAVEYRILQQRLAHDQLDGFLVEVDRDMGDYARFGLGYNFSHFSDNLFLENNYDAKGFFIRAQAFF